jgi:hypothetical protein
VFFFCSKEVNVHPQGPIVGSVAIFEEFFAQPPPAILECGDVTAFFHVEISLNRKR